MKIAGILTLTVGITVALVLSLWPTQLTYFGSTGSCGPPLTTAISDASPGGPFADQCHSQSVVRMIVAFAVLGVSAVGGVVMVANAPRPPAPPAPYVPQWRPPPAPPRYDGRPRP